MMCLMLKIVIHNPESETVIANIATDDLSFWLSLLDGAVQGEIKIYEMESGREYDCEAA